MPKLTPEIVAAMRTERRRGMTYTAMADLAGVHWRTVRSAVRGFSWWGGVPVEPVLAEENERLRRRFFQLNKRARRLTHIQVRAIRRRAAAGEHQRDLAREFGCSGADISFIVNRKYYTDVLD